MFFVLSKMLIFLLSPTLWIFIFFIITLITKKSKLKKVSFIASLILFILFSNNFLLNQFAKLWDVKETSLPANINYSCAIVLGGFGSEDANKKGYFNFASDRFIQAIKLKTEGKVSHLLISGGNASLFPTDFKEGDWVELQLKDLKISDSCVLIENRSRNSYENAVFSKKLLDSGKLKPPYLLVTSAFHMRRALYVYKKMGVDVIPFPCNYFAGRGETTFSSFIPNGSALAGWEIYIKEFIGYIIYFTLKK